MPLLRDLNCSIEPSGDAVPLQEFGTVYGDGVVETFVPVPKKQQTFTVHLSSTNFIAPGIAMYVFIDGIYQCNRNRQNMKLRKPPDRRSLVDFKVRQKEERQKDGSMIAREWTFEKLDHATADSAPASSSPTVLANIGCIEVVVLRCAGPRKEKTDTNLNIDGAADYWLNHDSRSRATAFDDRNPFASAATLLPHRKDSDYHTHDAKTARSRRHSRKDMSRPISPHTRFVPEFPMPGVQYGAGPLPPESSKERHRDPSSEAGRHRASRATPAVDPAMLEKIVADAVKRGVAESKKEARSVDDKESIWSRSHESESPSQIPGAWPSPATDSSATEERRPSRTKAKSREGLEWDEASMINGWGSLVDDPTDSWEDDDTWPISKKTSSKHGTGKKDSSSQSQWGGKKRPEKASSSWGDADKDGADWGDDKGKGWGSENADEMKDSAWESEKKVDDGWGSLGDTKDSTKNPAADSWDIDDSKSMSWGKIDTKDDGVKEQPSGDGGANGWSESDQWDVVPNSDGWGKDDKAKDSSGFDTSADPWGLNKKVDHAANSKSIVSPWGASSEPAPKDKASEKAPSKRHTSKSLSKYRQLSAPTPTQASHRQFPPPLPKKALRPVVSERASDHSGKKKRIPSVPAEPLHKIPLSIAEEKGVQHQVLAGPGTQYGHAVSRPEYIDRLDDPYAVFRFKYRSRSVLRSMFGDTCLSKTGTQKVAPRKEDLEALSRDELVKRMMALQMRLGSEDERETQCTQSVAKGLTEKWVKAHSREVSEVEGWKRA
ncbi:hypothetical protein E8E13_008543 [Curvularia kusanoi]|uniref:Uncharacterized protein n=1 Tax=Curvularia kusanoi TaxID=90978 RepID=A0A9P4TCZ0_CURKU|nr:hypothetical protein E8E13_008543 [Curvularia kusanoi]